MLNAFPPSISPASGFSYPVTANPTGPAQASRPADAPTASDANRAASQQVPEDERPESSERGPGQDGENLQGLSEQELKQLTDLKARDREVRAHEAAHQAVGGQHAGAISFTYQRGPDGAQYAVGGEVSIDLSPVPGDPQGTIEKMRIVRAAAMAPAEPSGQDRAVAAQAMQIMLQAQSDLAAETVSSRMTADSTYREVSAMVVNAQKPASAFEPVSA